MTYDKHEISARLRRAGHTAVSVAQALKVRQSAVSGVISGAVTSHRIAYRISCLVGVDACDLWPGKYKSPISKYKKIHSNELVKARRAA